MALAVSIPLLINGSATGIATVWPGGQGVFTVIGTFGGATVKLQFLGPDQATWIDAGSATTLTANGAGLFYLHACQIRAFVSGGAPSGIFAEADRVVY